MSLVREALLREGLQVDVQAHGPFPVPTTCDPATVPLTDISFIDDSAVPVMDPTPQGLLVKLARVTTIVDDLLTQHALFLNYAVNKTAALVAFRGPGSKQLRQQYQAGPSGELMCETLQGSRALPL
eukprot:5708555-Alexandrium_andersonii.AAC.1